MGYIYELKRRFHLIVVAWRENIIKFGEKYMQDGLRNFFDMYM